MKGTIKRLIKEAVYPNSAIRINKRLNTEGALKCI